MYLINITIKAEQVPENRADQLLAGHRAWFKEQFDQDHFLLVGPYKNKGMAGLVLAQAESRQALEDLLAKDAYYAEELADYEVSEFTANLIADQLTDFRGQ